MKNIVVVCAVLLSMVACKNETKSLTEINQEINSNYKTLLNYPETIKSIFDAHGGVETWSEMNALRFEIPLENGSEKHTVALRDRRSLIEANQWTIGYDGTDVWLLEQEEEVYKGNARFYHNLMFYFYAMPFVLADDGVNYSLEPKTELDGTLYEGVKISYDAGIGDAPKDEYIAYFDSETHLMTWLAYTVTYRSNEKSSNWRYIKYADWQELNGLVLPKTLTWYNLEDGKPTEPRSSRHFENVQVSKGSPDASLFVRPKEAKISER